ncbi:MAG: DUF4167 domain-containing protein [Hyphomicrobiaceae bacterium]
MNKKHNSRSSRLATRCRPELISTNNFAEAKKRHERYLELAQASARLDDHVATENLYQHAEHYFRVMKGELTEL